MLTAQLTKKRTELSLILFKRSEQTKILTRIRVLQNRLVLYKNVLLDTLKFDRNFRRLNTEIFI